MSETHSREAKQKRTWGQNLFLVLAAVVWIATIGIGYQKVWAYALTPGAPAAPPQQWPAGLRFARNHQGPTVVMLAHPHCPCTRASLGELRKIMSSFPEVRAYIFLLQPEGFDPDWAKTSIWKSANSVRGAAAVIDAKGTEAARFGAHTSGQVVVYDKNGKLSFSGGITPSRGHAGDNLGSNRILAIFNGEKVDEASSLVFGCSLQDPSESGSL